MTSIQIALALAFLGVLAAMVVVPVAVHSARLPARRRRTRTLEELSRHLPAAVFAAVVDVLGSPLLDSFEREYRLDSLLAPYPKAHRLLAANLDDLS